MKLDKNTLDNIEQLAKEKTSITSILKHFGFVSSTRNIKQIREFLKSQGIDTSHFYVGHPRKYDVINKKCPICGNVFESLSGHPREKVTCSGSCSNTYFARKKQGNKKYTWYRTICFKYHKKECVVCKENKAVDVHHFDSNKKNNLPENLIPICPTHHQYWHSKHRHLIFDKVNQFREEFINSGKKEIKLPWIKNV